MTVNDFIEKMKTDKRFLLILVMAGLLLVIVAIKFMKAESKEVVEQKSVAMMDVPDAEKTQMQDSKLGSYNAAEKIWDKNADLLLDEDLYRESRQSKGNQPSEKNADDVVNNLKVNDELHKTSRTSSSSSSYRSSYREQRMREYYESTEAFVPKEQKQETTETENEFSEVTSENTTSIGESATIRKSSAMSTLDGGSSGFSSLTDDDSISTEEDYPFECMFVREERLHNGSRVSVRLLEDMVVGGVLIPQNTHLMAMCSIGERLELKITSIEMNSKIYALGYEAYDNDGSKGIYCPDINAQARKTAKSQGLSTISSLLGGRLGRLASTAVNTGVSIAQSKSGEITVTVPSGYRFFIVKTKK